MLESLRVHPDIKMRNINKTTGIILHGMLFLLISIIVILSFSHCAFISNTGVPAVRFSPGFWIAPVKTRQKQNLLPYLF